MGCKDTSGKPSLIALICPSIKNAIVHELIVYERMRERGRGSVCDILKLMELF